MPATRTDDQALIVAAQAGDRGAMGELVTAHLPFLYTIVRRALGAHPDVDDVVQEVMLRVLRQLPTLRDAESFRAWLAAIAVRQVSTYLHREHLAAERAAVLDEVAEAADPGSDVEGSTLLRVELSAQRRQVVRASQWLDPDDRALVPLWWLETAGQLTRSELAAALGVSIAHAGVRVQRMRNQLDLSRSVVAALTARPGCGPLGAVIAGWDGTPSPLWRKRIARHVRTCAVCTQAGSDLVAAERLLVEFALLPVPVTLAAALIGKGTLVGVSSAGASASAVSAAASAGAGAVKGGLVGSFTQAIGAHPIAAAVAAGVLLVGAAIAGVNVPPSSPPGSSAGASSAAPRAAPLALGPASLESANVPGLFVSTRADLGILAPLGADGSPERRRTTFEVVPGLADARCFSFRAADGRYLRHASWRLRLSWPEGTALFRGDATFCERPGSVPGSVSLESSNYPGWFLRHSGAELWVDRGDGTPAFRADSSFLVRSQSNG